MKQSPVNTGRFYACALALVAACVAARALAAPAMDKAALTPLIQSLADPSADVRDEAYAKLFSAGRSARATLMGYVDDDSPTRRKLVRQLLKELPLFDEAEPALMRNWLMRYLVAEPNDRPALALQMAADPKAATALTRVIFEAADESTGWTIINRLESADRVRIADLGRAEGYVPSNAPQWFLVGDVATDQTQKLEAFQKAFDKARSIPPDALPAISRVANALCAAACDKGDAQTELSVRRGVALLWPSTDALSLPACTYLETRLRLRSLEGFDDDLLTLDLPPASPEVAFVRAILSASPKPIATVPTLLRDVPAPIVRAADNLKPFELLRMLELLRRAGDIGLADAFASRLASQLRGVEEPMVRYNSIRALALRYGIAVDSGADPKAALRTFTGQLPGDPFEPGIELEDVLESGSYAMFCNWQTAAVRRAVELDDQPMINRLLDQLTYVPFSSSRAAIDAVYLFETYGRPEAAEEAYIEYASIVQAQFDAMPNLSSPNNSWAWFNARTGRNLQKAYDRARRAAALDPGSGAIADTLAEAAFRLGKVDEAVAAERLALASRPGDPFMTGQLRRFEAGLRPGDASRPLFSEAWVEPIVP